MESIIQFSKLSIINKIITLQVVIYVVKAASLYFYFEHITAGDISQQIKRLDITKATQESDIPTKLVKRFDNITDDYLQENFNKCLKKGTFPKDFKKAVLI